MGPEIVLKSLSNSWEGSDIMHFSIPINYKERVPIYAESAKKGSDFSLHYSWRKPPTQKNY